MSSWNLHLTTCCAIYYNMIMLKTYLYIPEQLDEKIKLAAKTQNKSKAEVIRQALQEGLNIVEKQNKGGAEILLELAELTKRNKVRGPKDLSVNHDYYLWGGKKKYKI